MRCDQDGQRSGQLRITTGALAALLLATVPAGAAERSVGIGSFQRLRVEGPFEVAVTAGPPSARVSGDRRAIEAVEVRLDGATLVVRPGAGPWGERGGATAGPIRISLATPALAAAQSTGGARITVARMRAERVDLTVAGAGAIAATGVDAGEIVGTLAGAGKLTLAGRARRARLVRNGEGTLDAAALDAGDVLLAADGIGDTAARARYTAQVSNTGVGQVTVSGDAKCAVRGGGPITCGAGR